MLRRAAFVQQKAALAAILLNHAVADKAIANARHHRCFADFLGHAHDGGQHVFAGLLAAHHFQQLHDVGRAEEMQTDHVLRSLGKCGNLVHVQCRGVGRQNRAGLHHTVEFLEDFFLDAHFLKHGLNHHVSVFQIVVAQRGAEQAHALLVFVLLEFAFFDL